MSMEIRHSDGECYTLIRLLLNELRRGRDIHGLPVTNTLWGIPFDSYLDFLGEIYKKDKPEAVFDLIRNLRAENAELKQELLTEKNTCHCCHKQKPTKAG